MKMRMLPVVIGIMAWLVAPSAAQEKLPPAALVGEMLPPATVSQPTIALHDPDCSPGCERPGIKILWLEHQAPLQRIVSREVVTEERTKTLEVQYREEKRVITEIVLKPREVVKEVSCCTMQPVTVTDPCTGACSTVLKPVTEIKQVREIEYAAVPEERELIVRVPCLKEVEKVVPNRTVLFEYKTELRREGFPLAIPDVVPRLRYLAAPCPPLPCPPQ